MRFDIVPEGTNRAASLPNSAASAILKFDHRGVFTPDVVAHDGGGHGGPHCRSGTGDGVAAEVFGNRGAW